MSSTDNTRVIRTVADLYALRADTAFHEGAVALLTYPTADPVAYISHDNPKGAFGRVVAVGNTVTKGPAGDFKVTTHGTGGES